MPSLSELKVSDLLKNKPTRAVLSIEPQKTIIEASLMMKEKNVGILIVRKDSKPDSPVLGVISERDIVRRIVAEKKSTADCLVESIMTTKLIYTCLEESMEDCLMKMNDYHCRHLPVGSAENPLVDVLSDRDIMTYLTKAFLNQSASIFSKLEFGN